MKKLLLIAALIVALLVPFSGRAAELNNITSAGVDGNLVFYDKSGNAIMTLDAANRKLSFPSGSLLETLGTTITLGNISYTVPTNNGDASQYLQTNGSGVLTWAAGTSAVTAWNDIGDATADGTVANAGYKQTFTSTLNAAGAVITMTNTTADLTADVSFIDLKYTDDGDANGYFIRAYDNAGGDLKFSVAANGAVTIAGTAEGTNALTITGGDATLTDGDLILSSGDLSVTGNFTLTGSFYQSAIAAAAAGNVNLTVDAAGNGTITIGGTSTGNTVLPGPVVMNGNVDIGNAATDTLTITSIIDGNVTLDDGVTDSPSLIFKDATDETATLAKVDGANLDLTTSATEGLRIMTGNLRVGNGSPGTAAMDGEDFYVNGDSEFDGAVTLDGAVTFNATPITLLSNSAVVIGHATNGAGDDLTIQLTGANDSSIILDSAGTGTDAISLQASAGGVDIDAPAAQDVNIAGGQVALVSKDDAASAISLTTNIGVSETIVITNSAGTGESAITLVATLGGVNIDAAAAKDLDLAGGQVKLVSKDDAAGAISLTANIGTSETITVTNTLGTSESAITLLSSAGGVNIDAASGKDVDIAGGQVLISSKTTGASAIALTTNQGAAETIVVTNTQGTGTGAITLTATAGGITLNAGLGGITTGDAITGDGTAALGGFLKTVTDDADAHAVGVAESGTILTNAGAIGAFAHTLPGAAIGLNYCFIVMAAQELRVTPAAGDVINIAGIAADAAEYWTANAAGESLCIVAVDVTNWVATSFTGTWTQATP